MIKNSLSKSGLSNFRVLGALVFGSIGASLGWFSFASTPPTDSITVPSTPGQTVTVTWTGTIPPFTNTNPLTGSDCAAFAGTSVVDQHVSSVVVPAGVYSNVDAIFTFKITWNPTTGQEPENDEILTVLDPSGNEINSSDGGSTTESLRMPNLPAGDYQSVVCGYQNVGQQPYTGTLTITTCPVGSGCRGTATGPFGGPDPTVPGNPRYQNFYAPTGSGAESSEGEFNIGFDQIGRAHV